MPSSLPRKRLLIVDDEPGTVERLRPHFAARYEVDTATSPKAGALGYVPKPLNLVDMDHMVALAGDQLPGRRAG